MKLNVYVVGSATSYANWLLNNPDGENGKLVTSMEEADIVVLTGGGDVDPSYYGRQTNSRTYSTPPREGFETRDSREWEAITRAVELGKPMWGTCRGLQILCAFAGGDLIQHVNHGGGDHPISFYDGTSVMTNTIHHQMVYPFAKLKPVEDYFIVANALGLSNVYLGEEGENLVLPTNEQGITLEPEAAFFPKINGFGQQSHLEMRGYNSPVVNITRKLVEHQVKGTLSEVLKQQIPVSQLIDPSFKLEVVNNLVKSV